MLDIKLFDLTEISILRSDFILHQLLQEKSFALKSSSLMNIIRSGNAHKFRIQDIQNQISHRGYEEFSLNYDFDILDDMFDNYFSINGDSIFVKDKLLDRYSSFINKIHPYFIIGYKLACELQSDNINLQEVHLFAENISHLGFKIDDGLEFAENHIHLGGAVDTVFSLSSILESHSFDESYYKEDILNELPHIAEFPYINTKMYSIGTIMNIFQESFSFINESIICNNVAKSNMNYVLNDIPRVATSYPLYNFSFFEQFKCNSLDIKTKLFCLALDFHKKNNTNKAMFVYIIFIFLNFRTTKNLNIKKNIKIFIHSFNILRSYMTMSTNLGLGHFIEFYNSKLRNFENNIYSNVAYNIYSNGTTKLNGKITPNNIPIKKIISILKPLEEVIEDISINKNKQYQLLKDDNIFKYHFTIHFIKEKEKRDDSYEIMSPRFHNLRLKNKKYAFELDDFLNTFSNKYINAYDFLLKFNQDIMNTLKNEKLLKSRHINLTNIILEIDAAGDETATPIEVFSPAIRYIRRDFKKNINSFSKKTLNNLDSIHPKLKLSIHAGEDFNHIVSGMRTVDESIEFNEMIEDDRLGHALAIGIDPKEWIKKKSDFSITKEEYLDNMIWLRKKLELISEDYKKALSFISVYETKINKYFSYIYNFKDTYTFNELYEAWELRGCCPMEIDADIQNNTSRTNEYSYNSIKFYKKNKPSDKVLQILKHYHYSRNVYHKGSETISIGYIDSKKNNQTKYIYDEIITKNEINLYEAIQDSMINKCAEIGIIIEVNPSSNIYTADLDCYSLHPIFRWNPPDENELKDISKFNKYGLRTGKLRVCINSDDPGIFPTTLQNEFNTIKMAGIKYHNYGEVEISHWLDDIRKFGISIFDNNHKAIYVR